MARRLSSGAHNALHRLNIPDGFDLSWLPDHTLELLRRDESGERYKDIAAAVGLNLGTVKSRLNRARAKIAAKLAEIETGSA